MEPIEFTCAVRANGTNTIRLPHAAAYYIRVCVLDVHEERVPDAAYSIYDDNGEILFEGKTDAQGLIDHDGVPLRDYELVIGPYETAIPALAYRDERWDVFLPALGFIRLTVSDETEKPVAEADYEILDEGQSIFSGSTDAEGHIKHDGVSLDDYDLLILDQRVTIPAVAYDDEFVPVFLRAHSAGQG